LFSYRFFTWYNCAHFSKENEAEVNVKKQDTCLSVNTNCACQLFAMIGLDLPLLTIAMHKLLLITDGPN